MISHVLKNGFRTTGHKQILHSLRSMYYIALKDGRIEKNELFKLLTPDTHTLILKELFTDKITLADILQKSPDLYILELGQTGIDTQDSWLQDLMKYKSEKDFRKLGKLNITINNSDFDFEMLANFVKTKCGYGAEINISIAILNYERLLHSTHIDEFKANKPDLLKYFTEVTASQKFDERTYQFKTVYYLDGDAIDEKNVTVHFDCIVSCGTSVTQSCGIYVLKSSNE